MRPQYDVVIAGGGAVGSSCAYHLKCVLNFAGSVLVVEPDPTYRDAASTRSASSIRLQFSTPINIELSGYGLEFLRDAPVRLRQSVRGGLRARARRLTSTWRRCAAAPPSRSGRRFSGRTRCR